MKIQTFSIVVGGSKCNAKCPYCVSKLTGKEGLCEEINMRNLHKACKFAKMSGVSTVLLTGKGEPLLYPDLITKYLEILDCYDFPFIELQTNGIALPNIAKATFAKWYDLGLTLVSLSCVHWYGSESRKIYGKEYKEVSTYAEILHDAGFSVRASCVMYSGKVCDEDSVVVFARHCKEWGIEQLTVRPVTNISFEEALKDAAKNDAKMRVYEWVKDHSIAPYKIENIVKYFDYHGTLLLELAHGAKVYDFEGQNVTISNCLTHSSNPDDIRQLIFFPDGHLRFSWTLPGAIII